MELLYPGYKSYFSRFRTKPFHTEYTTRYCNSEAPVLYSQVPRYTWYEPRRPTVAARHELGGTTKLTHLRPPFAARMTSYETEGKYLTGGKMACEEATLLDRKGSSERKNRLSMKLPEVFPPSSERGLSREECTGDHGLQRSRMFSTQNTCEATTSAKPAHLSGKYQCTSSSGVEHGHMRGWLEPKATLSTIASSFSAARGMKFDKAPCTSTRDPNPSTSSRPSSGDRRTLRRVAPRPTTLLSKYAKDVRYVRDTCFFHPTQERKKHYYIVNPNWFSEQRVTVPKNNVFS